jgi:tRNA(Ile)-lysidine synthase
MPLKYRLETYISQNELFEKDDRILVAVSGGIDSTALLHILAHSGYEIAIAHCNFNLRGEESDEDEKFVKQLQRNLKVDGYYIHFDTENEATKAGESIQMAARRLRYDWFKHICNTENYQYIAIAHNADDVAETFMLNLTRGTGIRGLTGIKPKSGRVVRPLLFATRKEIEAYAKHHAIEHREDSSNVKDKYARNRIRLNVIPQLREINPSFSQTMLENIARLQQVEELVNAQINDFKRDLVAFDKGEARIDIRKLKFNRNASLLLYEFLAEYGFNGSQTQDIVACIEDGEPGSTFRTDKHILVRDRNHLIITATPTETKEEEFCISEENCSINRPIKLLISKEKRTESFKIERSSQIAQLDFDKLEFPLILRKWQNGDEFHPLGMVGKKKLSDFFIDEKMSILEKSRQWVLCTNRDIVWIVGRRIDNRYKITPATNTVLTLKIEE